MKVLPALGTRLFAPSSPCSTSVCRVSTSTTPESDTSDGQRLRTWVGNKVGTLAEQKAADERVGAGVGGGGESRRSRLFEQLGEDGSG